MKKICLSLVMLFAFAGLVSAQNGATAGAGAAKLREVKKIYVGELGRTDDADIVREKIKLRLTKTGQYIIVSSPEAADAVMTGTVVISQQVDGTWRDIDTKNKGVAVIYLRNARTDETLWIYEFKPKFFNVVIFTDKATRGYNQVANQTVERLLKDSGLKAK